MSCHTGKGNIFPINSITSLLVYLGIALSSLILAKVLEGVFLFLWSNCSTVQKTKLCLCLRNETAGGRS